MREMELASREERCSGPSRAIFSSWTSRMREAAFLRDSMLRTAGRLGFSGQMCSMVEMMEIGRLILAVMDV